MKAVGLKLEFEVRKNRYGGDMRSVWLSIIDGAHTTRFFMEEGRVHKAFQMQPNAQAIGITDAQIAYLRRRGTQGHQPPRFPAPKF
jgi:hypothetical protein